MLIACPVKLSDSDEIVAAGIHEGACSVEPAKSTTSVIQPCAMKLTRTGSHARNVCVCVFMHACMCACVCVHVRMYPM